jgi:rhomboid protease GluP
MRESKGKAILCPECKKLIGSDTPMCPFCGTVQPGSGWKRLISTRIFSDAHLIIQVIIYLNAGLFLLSLFLNERLPGLSPNPFHLLSPENKSILLLGATGTIPIDHYGRWWTIVSANYLHGSLLHILFNMIAFKQLAPLVAREFNTSRFFILYTLGGAAGFWISYRAGVTFTIGASAAICSLIGAMVFFGKSRGGPYGRAVFRQIGGWALIIFAFGLLVPNINNWGHAGGFFIGMAIAYFLGYEEKSPEHFSHKLIAGLCAVATVLILFWAVSSGIYYRFNA